MIGRLPHSALSISASSLGNTIFYAIAFCAVFMLNGVETLVAQAYGRNDRNGCSRTLAQSLWFVVIGTPLVMLATLAAIPMLTRFGISSEIVAETRRYLDALVWSTAPLLLYMALRRYLQSIDRVLLVTVSLVTAGLVNFGADWAFLYGHVGVPAMGIAGSAWATCLVRVYVMVLLLAGVWLSFRHGEFPFAFAMLRPDMSRLRALFRIGWPSAIYMLADLSVSTYMSVLCARLGATLLAAHQVVLDLDAFVYMVPLGLSWATVVRVGQSAGRNSLVQVRRAANASLLLATGYLLVASTLFASLPRLWAGLYSNDGAVVAAAAPVFLLCGFLQFGDAIGVIFASALTGVGDTRTSLIVNTAWYWLLGMPLSYWLTFDRGLAVRGLWIGRMVAAIGSAATLALAWQWRLRRAEGDSRARTLTSYTPMHAK